ncbi:uncharacterized protein LOC144427675 [Styela clava]
MRAITRGGYRTPSAFYDTKLRVFKIFLKQERLLAVFFGLKILMASGIDKRQMFVLVGGYNGGEGDSGIEPKLKDSCWTIYSYVHDISYRNKKNHEENIRVIVNASKSMKACSESDIIKIHKLLWDERQFTCNGITHVLFGHSHSALIIYDACKTEALRKFLIKENTPEENIENAIQQIRDRLAIFSLEGIQDIPKDYAKSCLNIRLEDDTIATFGKKLVGRATKCNKKTIPKTKSKDTKSEKKNFSSTVFADLSQSSWDKANHVLREYVNNEDVLKTIDVYLKM